MKRNSIRSFLKNRIKSEKGESIAEVLVAVLVVAFGALLLATMVTASFRILKRSEQSFQTFLAGNNIVASSGAGTGYESEAEDSISSAAVGYSQTPAKVSVKVVMPNQSPISTDISVNVYSINENGSKTDVRYEWNKNN